MRTRCVAITLAFAALAVSSLAQKRPNTLAGYDQSARATVVHEAKVYIAADSSSQGVSLVTPGHEIVIMERSGPWVRVFANTDVEENSEEVPMFGQDEAAVPVAGWIKDKGILGPTSSQGDMLLFGAAANAEAQAEEPHAPKNAAQSAHLLYRRVYEYFPQSPLAGEAAWRSADIRWQIEKQDVSTLPSAREKESYLRPQIYDEQMKKVIKLFPGSKWAALAAYDLIDNKLCGDWQGLPKCPEQEAGMYLKYAAQFPNGPKTAEALYNAAYRQGVLVDMYSVDGDHKKADQSAARAKDITQQIQATYPQSEYAARAIILIYKLQQSIPIYGSDRD